VERIGDSCAPRLFARRPRFAPVHLRERAGRRHRNERRLQFVLPPLTISPSPRIIAAKADPRHLHRIVFFLPPDFRVQLVGVPETVSPMVCVMNLLRSH
jgi:hypothetical protein